MARFLTISTRVVVKIAAIRDLGPGPMLARQSPAHSGRQTLSLRALTLKELALRANKPRVFTPTSGGDSVFGPPLTLRPEYSGAYVRTYILFERPNAADEFKRTKEGHRPAPTPLNETRFLPYKPGKCGWARARSRDTRRYEQDIKKLEAPPACISAD